MAKQIQTPTDVVKIEKSGVRFNAWDTNGVKRTSEITTGARKRAYEGGYWLIHWIGLIITLTWERLKTLVQH